MIANTLIFNILIYGSIVAAGTTAVVLTAIHLNPTEESNEHVDGEEALLDVNSSPEGKRVDINSPEEDAQTREDLDIVSKDKLEDESPSETVDGESENTEPFQNKDNSEYIEPHAEKVSNAFDQSNSDPKDIANKVDAPPQETATEVDVSADGISTSTTKGEPVIRHQLTFNTSY